jgi:hypothetical protein
MKDRRDVGKRRRRAWRVGLAARGLPQSRSAAVGPHESSKAALPFEVPKLAVTTVVPWTDSFAEALDRAIQRSQIGMKVIEHQPAPASPQHAHRL